MVKEYFAEASIANFTPHPSRPQTLFKNFQIALTKYLFYLSVCALHSLSAYAWRPMIADDTTTQVKGVAHIETMWLRDTDGSRSLSIIPTYSPWPGLDLVAIENRPLAQGSKEQTLQAKIQISSARFQDCAAAWVLGITVWQKGDGPKSFFAVNGTCDIPVGSLYSSLVGTRDLQGRDVSSFSMTWEHQFGAWAAYIETVSQRTHKPYLGFGVRRDVVPGLQLEGMWGKQGGQPIFSLGSRYSF